MTGIAKPVAEVLADGTLTMIGRLVEASNLAILGEVTLERTTHRVIYKPERGEEPLWDFPSGGLARRERAAWLVSQAGGWGVVPPTVLRDGPLGPGSVQLWIGDPDDPCPSPVGLAPAGAVPDGAIAVLSGQDEAGREVVVTHPDEPRIASVVVFDAVVNNSDRKGSHLLDEAGHLWGIDHGVCFHAQDKLRTVLWGWAGQALPEAEVARLTALEHWLEQGADELDELLIVPEVEALRTRVRRLLTGRTFPLPSRGWPAVPWPPL